MTTPVEREDIAVAAGNLRELCDRWLDANDPKRDTDCDVCQVIRSLVIDLAIAEDIDQW